MNFCCFHILCLGCTVDGRKGNGHDQGTCEDGHYCWPSGKCDDYRMFYFAIDPHDQSCKNPSLIYNSKHKMNVYQSFQIIDIYPDLGTSSLVC